ncbi:hypothetical protein C0995_013453 [Termitomyces sp. Mi166|nr:hypothetical protein C0995_013453 [Termitomyces sp. Mi166\
MVLSLAEEVRKAEGIHHSKEVVRLQGVIIELEDAVKRYKKEIETRKMRRPARPLTPLLIPPPLHPMPRVSGNPTCPAFLSSTPDGAAKPAKTPITPPTSLIRSGLRQPCLLDLSSSLITDPENASYSNQNLPDTSLLVPSAVTPLTPAPSESPYSEITFFLEPPSSVEPQSSPPSPAAAHDQGCVHLVDAVTEARDDGRNPDVAVIWIQQKERATLRKPPTMAETASCLVTGFFIGAFITLCLLLPQRRTLLTHLT